MNNDMAMIIASTVLVIVVMAAIAVTAWSAMGACVALLLAQIAGLITAWLCLISCFLAKLIAHRRREKR